MRLTLRTLLAWLDDTLPPVEVRQIGHQVAESPFAQELVERIHRVARQRRLTVPNATGADATDANLVAAYLDNELSPDQVGDYEKRCLTSDVHLAEVASAHQILSLIGQKAKVPVDARHRMYRLVKGREALSPRVPRAFGPPEPEPLTEPLVPWAPPPPPPRSWVERFGPAAFVTLLIVVLLWSTWMSLNPSQPSPGSVALSTPAGTKAAPPAGNIVPGKAVIAPDAAPAVPPLAAPGQPGPASQPASKEGTAAGAPGEAPPAPSPADSGTPSKKASLPAGDVGVAGNLEGILLRYSPKPTGRVWERLKPQAPIEAADRLVSLDHYRNSVQLGPARVTLVGDSEVRALTPDRGLAARFELVRGRVVVNGANPPAAVGVTVPGGLLRITPPPDSPIGLEFVGSDSAASSVRIYVPLGDVKLAAAESTDTLAGPSLVNFETPDKFTGKEKKDAPTWVTDESISPLDKQLGEQLARYFKSDRKVIGSLLEAIDDPQKDVRQLAISTLGSIDQVDLVVSALSTPGQKISRQAAIRVLRSLLARGGDSAQAVSDKLKEAMGEEQAAIVKELLVGYASKEVRDDSTYKTLVQLLTSNDAGIRELALDNLETLTGRNDLGYDPDVPEGEGLKHWQDLLRRKELRPLAPPTPK
jgi:hypothetical protein